MLAAVATFVAWMLLGPTPRSTTPSSRRSACSSSPAPARWASRPDRDHGRDRRAAELGSLFRRGPALEALAKADTAVLDKTGTLTKGRPELVATHALDGDETQALRLAASAESLSEHPLARAIVAAAQARGVDWRAPEAFRADPGRGVEARCAGQDVLVGTARSWPTAASTRRTRLR